MPEEKTQQPSQTSPKIMFVLGLLSAVALVSLVGFFILLSRQGGAGKGSAQPSADTSGTDAPDVPTTPQNITLAEITKDDHIRGPLDAPVKIVEYSDLECPFCKRHHPTMMQIVEEYDGKVAWVYRHFPLVSLHSQAPKEAEATECAAELGGNDGFWAMTDTIFEVTPANNGLDLATLPDLAEQVGLDKEEFQECLDSGRHAGKVQAQYEDASQAGGQGTPYNVIIGPNGDKVPLAGAYPIDSFKQIIDSLLE